MDKTIELAERLAGITIGATAVVRGVAVTRWAEDAFELGTLGKAPCINGAEAIGTLLATGSGPVDASKGNGWRPRQ